MHPERDADLRDSNTSIPHLRYTYIYVYTQKEICKFREKKELADSMGEKQAASGTRSPRPNSAA